MDGFFHCSRCRKAIRKDQCMKVAMKSIKKFERQLKPSLQDHARKCRKVCV
jgi:hypothetical protein